MLRKTPISSDIHAVMTLASMRPQRNAAENGALWSPTPRRIARFNEAAAYNAAENI